MFKTGLSDLCVAPRNEWAFGDLFGENYSVVKAHQWSVLSRRDATRFVENWAKLSFYHKFVVKGEYRVCAGRVWVLVCFVRKGLY